MSGPLPARRRRRAPLGAAATIRSAILDRYCVTCHNERARSSATSSGVVLDTLDPRVVAPDAAMWEKVVRKLRTGAMPPAGMPRARPAAHDRAGQHISRRALDREAARSGRIPAGRTAPAEPCGVRQRDPRPAGARGRTRRRCCRRTIRRTASTTTPTCSGVSPALLERYLSAAAKISALAVGSRDDRPRAPKPIASAATRRRTTTTTGLPLGTRGGLAGTAHVSARRRVHDQGQAARRPTSDRFAGFEYTHQLEITVDGERKLLAPVGGADDYTRSSMNATDIVQLARPAPAGAGAGAGRPATGERGVPGQERRRSGGSRLQPFERTHADRHRPPGRSRTSRASRSAARSTPPAPATRRAAARVFVLPAARPGRRAGLRADDRVHAGAARLSAAGDRRGPDAADGVLRRRPAPRGRLRRAASSWRCAACSSARSSCSASSVIPAARGGVRRTG